MTSTTPHSRHSPCHRLHATTGRKRALRTSGVEKWDVVMWNDQVHSSQESSTPNWHSSTLRSTSDSTISDSTPRACISKDVSSLASTQSAPAPSIPCFATTASAFGFGNDTSTRPRPIRRKSSHEPAVQCHQTRLDALSALHRSVEEHDAGFLARMRELEERCHLLPDSLSVLRSSDLATPSASRGRKRDAASWDEDGDVEMSCWNERRTKHRSARSDSPVLFGSGASTCDDKATHSDDEYVVADHDGTDSHSCSDDEEEEEDDDLDIVIVPGGSSAPSLAASSPSSLSTSLSSLPARAGTPPLHQYTPSTHIPGTIKGVDELAAAMAGGAGSVVEWSVPSDVPDDGSHFIADIAQAGALWA